MKRNFLPVYAFSLALLLMLSVGCAKKLDDAKMSSEIQGRFSQDSGLASKQLTVQANNGVVTLSGTVDNAAQRDAAGQQAASVAGVKTVINNLEVGDASSSAAPASPPAPTEAANAVPDKPEAGTTLKKAEKPRREHAHAARNTDSGQNQQQPVAMNNPPAPDAPAPPPASNATVIPATPPPPPAPKKLIIDQGTQLAVRLIDPIDSEKNQVGDTFHATLNAALASDGQPAVPAGVEVTGHVVDVKSASKFAGKSLVVLQLDTLSAGGKRYDLQTDQYRKETATRGKNTAEKVGGGAVLGGIIGALAGGGKGAAIGAAAGAGVGGGVQAASKSQQIKLPSETVLNFTLQAPITVVEVESPDANRPKLSTSQ
jgi:hypothetical protein